MSEGSIDPQRSDDPGISRRSFVGLRWARPRTDQDHHGETEPVAPPPILSDVDLPQEIHLGTIDRLRSRAIGTVQKAASGRSSVYSVRVPEGLLAVWGRCPQDDCFVTWRPRDRSEDAIASTGRFYCSCDASVFDRRGEVVAGPAPRPLDVLPIELGERGSVIARSGGLLKREPGDETSGVFSLDEEVGTQ
jgi:Rieske Fe-S protein